MDYLLTDRSSFFPDWRLYHSDSFSEIQRDKTEQVPGGGDAAYGSV